MCIKKVITHGGAPHRDEFLALGLALSAEVISLDTPVLRRDPTDEELEDREVMVLDVGKHHDPMRHNFDHHQLPPEQGECALSLLAKHLRHNGLPYHNLFNGAPWYQAIITLDNFGPVKLAQELGLEKIPYEFISTVEVGIIDSIRGGSFSRLHLEIAKLVMDQKVSAAEAFLQQTPWLEANGKFLPVNGFYVALAYTKVTVGMNEFIRRHEKDVAVSVILDDRNDGMSLRRVDDDPRIDFRLIEGNPEVIYVHGNGFLAKTRKRLTEEELGELVKLATVR